MRLHPRNIIAFLVLVIAFNSNCRNSGHIAESTSRFSATAYGSVSIERHWIETKRFRIPDIRINSMAHSSDGETLAVVGGNGWAALYDATGSRMLRTLLGHKGDVLTVGFMPKIGTGDPILGEIVVTAGVDGYFRIWSATTGVELISQRAHSSDVLKLIFAQNQHEFATVGVVSDGIRVWNRRNGKLVRVLPVPFETEPEDAIIDQTREELILRSSSGELIIMSFRTGVVAKRLKAHGGSLGSVAITNSATFLLSAGEDVRIWRLETLNLVRKWMDDCRQGSVFSFTPDSQYLISAGMFNSIGIYSTKDWQPQLTIARTGRRYSAISVHPKGTSFVLAESRESYSINSPLEHSGYSDVIVFSQQRAAPCTSTSKTRTRAVGSSAGAVAR